MMKYLGQLVMCVGLLFGVVAQADDDETKVIVLGTGNPNPIPDRAGPAIVILAGGEPYIFDAGEGLVRQLEKARVKYGYKGLERTAFKHLFLTHLHWDHTIDVPNIILSPWTQEREVPINVYGPLGTVDMVENIQDAYMDDVRFRLDGLEPAKEEGWQAFATEFDGTFTYKDDNITVEAFPVCHGEIEQAVGFKITTKDKVIVISGDTTYCPIIAEKAKGVDILLHEGYPTKSHAKLPPLWAAYHTAYHTSAIDIARIANEANPKLVVLYHQLTWRGDPLSMIVDEIKETYDGNVVNAKDLDEY